VNCTKCYGEIRRGEKHVSIVRNVEVQGKGNILDRARGRGDAITVTDSESLATYHERCAPPSGA
jgi:hypothetical protein